MSLAALGVNQTTPRNDAGLKHHDNVIDGLDTMYKARDKATTLVLKEKANARKLQEGGRVTLVRSCSEQTIIVVDFVKHKEGSLG